MYDSQSAVSKFIPFADRILLKKIVPVAKVGKYSNSKNQSVGGILLPEDSLPQRNECEVESVNRSLGQVIAVGPGKYTPNGNLIPCTVKKGDQQECLWTVIRQRAGSGLWRRAHQD